MSEDQISIPFSIHDQTPIDRVFDLYRAKGVSDIYAKRLAENDNSKNQIYVGPDLATLNLLPVQNVIAERSKSKRTGAGFILKSSLNFFWLADDGSTAKAPGAQLIFYPQFPEVRLSGLLRGCRKAPQSLKKRESGRWLLVGATEDARVLAFLAESGDPLARQLDEVQEPEMSGVFIHLSVERRYGDIEARIEVLLALLTISEKGWIRSWRLDRNGHPAPCQAQNCGGYTLEAELGIRPNGFSEPDYLGWELKQYQVSNFSRLNSSVITLMTPQPNGGIYREQGAENFIRSYGYPDRNGKEGRYNFGGIHKVGSVAKLTGTSLHLEGFDSETGKLMNPEGGIVLRGPHGEEAAKWHYPELIQHWNRKHANAIYVPSRMCGEPSRSYSYGRIVRVGTGTEFQRLLSSLYSGDVYYDPAMKLFLNPASQWKVKTRSQFRIRSGNLAGLYDRFETVDLRSYRTHLERVADTD